MTPYQTRILNYIASISDFVSPAINLNYHMDNTGSASSFCSLPSYQSYNSEHPAEIPQHRIVSQLEDSCQAGVHL